MQRDRIPGYQKEYGLFTYSQLKRVGYFVSVKYSCGFPDPQVFPIIVVDRYLDYFTTIMEDRLWEVLAKPVSRCRNRSGLSMMYITVKMYPCSGGTDTVSPGL